MAKVQEHTQSKDINSTFRSTAPLRIRSPACYTAKSRFVGYFNYYAVPRHSLPIMVGDIQLLAADTLRRFCGIPADERNEAPGLKIWGQRKAFFLS